MNDCSHKDYASQNSTEVHTLLQKPSTLKHAHVVPSSTHLDQNLLRNLNYSPFQHSHIGIPLHICRPSVQWQLNPYRQLIKEFDASSSKLGSITTCGGLWDPKTPDKDGLGKCIVMEMKCYRSFHAHRTYWTIYFGLTLILCRITTLVFDGACIACSTRFNDDDDVVLMMRFMSWLTSFLLFRSLLCTVILFNSSILTLW